MSSSSTTSTNSQKSTDHERDQLLSIKETLVGIAIAFTMAFVFRGFVIEGFVIPTGSMAPTLLGQHYKAVGPESGYEWDVGPSPRSTSRETLEVTDPILGSQVIQSNSARLSGDRVFVLKYLDGIHDPKRWDVVVFKNPGTRENYIKRLIGKPGEQIAFVDGDVFVRTYLEGQTPRRGAIAWTGPGWEVARKNERVQRAVFQTVYDSRYTPTQTGPMYRAPFEGTGWTGLAGESAKPSFMFTGAGTGTLSWRANQSIDEGYPYNEMVPGQRFIKHFPVSDISFSFGVEPSDAGAVIPSIELDARGYEFHAEIVGSVGSYEAVLKMADAGSEAWYELDRQPLPDIAFTTGRVTNIEFWHVDQALWLFIDGELVAGGTEDGSYSLTPAQRVERATGNLLADALIRTGFGNGITTAGGLADTTQYRKPSLRVKFTGGPVTVHHARVDRDLHYHINRNNATNGAHPDYFPTLTNDRYFVCGDNSPNSKDSRLWAMNDGSSDPWVASEIDPKIPSVDRNLLDESQMLLFRDTIGTVHRDLLIGQGFLVYFPAPTRVFGIPVPDLGRARWIW